MIPRRVILHCSDTPDASKAQFGAKDIDAWHKAKGVSRIGYHDVVKRDGVREAGRLPTEKGAHTKDQNNDSIGICYIGRSEPTVRQIKTILRIYQDYKDRFKISWTQWFGHYEFNKHKACPGIPMDAMRLLLANFDAGDFDIDHSDDQIRTFLQVCSVRGAA